MSEKRMSKKDAEKAAADIQNDLKPGNGPDSAAAKEIIKEELVDGDGPLLREAAAERAEGGGPLADAVQAAEERMGVPSSADTVGDPSAAAIAEIEEALAEADEDDDDND